MRVQYETDRRASRKEKKRVLDEFTQVAGYPKKSAIPLLTTKPKRHNRTENRRGCPRQYGQEVTRGLRVAWEATDRICSKRLKPFLPELIGIVSISILTLKSARV